MNVFQIKQNLANVHPLILNFLEHNHKKSTILQQDKETLLEFYIAPVSIQFSHSHAIPREQTERFNRLLFEMRARGFTYMMLIMN